jgi:hypothetical protein
MKACQDSCSLDLNQTSRPKHSTLPTILRHENALKQVQCYKSCRVTDVWVVRDGERKSQLFASYWLQRYLLLASESRSVLHHTGCRDIYCWLGTVAGVMIMTQIWNALPCCGNGIFNILNVRTGTASFIGVNEGGFIAEGLSSALQSRQRPTIWIPQYCIMPGRYFVTY